MIFRRHCPENRIEYRDDKGGIGDFPDVRETPLHSLETDSSVKLVQ